jgi:hypothetical protein
VVYVTNNTIEEEIRPKKREKETSKATEARQGVYLLFISRPAYKLTKKEKFPTTTKTWRLIQNR